jgi:hypothetical protein
MPKTKPKGSNPREASADGRKHRQQRTEPPPPPGTIYILSSVRIVVPQAAALCGAPCTCAGAGCGVNHPGPGIHCQANPVCPAGCKGSCILGQGHQNYGLPDHACSHWHTF